MPFGLHWEYLLIILAIILIIFGPSKLPQLGGAIGKTMREFRKETSSMGDDVNDAIDKPDDEKPSVAAATEKSGK
ncbi:MAG: twin-arginine translocase TatA/TatE family subunit [Candidatus Dormibacteraeota bacterium]|nr:twin-arginine translocase TatA/TatE family subunit [Candidatus Dormibacteraeota bacterium]